MTESTTNRYNHSKLYKLQCEDGYMYIGSTTQALSKRLGEHKIKSKIYSERDVYSHINSIGWDKVCIVLVTEHCLENREQLLRAENELITKHKDDPFCLNKYRSKLTDEERKEYIKEYCENNKESLKEKKKEYRENNRKELNEKEKERKITNREKNRDRDSKVETCICGANYTHSHKLRHERTKKHINFINSHVGSSDIIEPNDTSLDIASGIAQQYTSSSS